MPKVPGMTLTPTLEYGDTMPGVFDPCTGFPRTWYGRCSNPECNRLLEWEEWDVDTEGLCYGCRLTKDEAARVICECGDRLCRVPGGCGWVLVDGYLKRKSEIAK